MEERQRRPQHDRRCQRKLQIERQCSPSHANRQADHRPHGEDQEAESPPPRLTQSRRVKSISSWLGPSQRRSSAPAPCRRSGRCPALPARSPGPSGRCRARFGCRLFLLFVVAGEVEIPGSAVELRGTSDCRSDRSRPCIQRRLAGIDLYRHAANRIDCRSEPRVTGQSILHCPELKFSTWSSPRPMSNQAPCRPSSPRCSRWRTHGKVRRLASECSTLARSTQVWYWHRCANDRDHGQQTGRQITDLGQPLPDEIAAGQERTRLADHCPEMPPHRPWPMMTTCSTPSCSTAYSSAAEVEWCLPSGA
jgi:hypothetical protein